MAQSKPTRTSSSRKRVSKPSVSKQETLSGEPQEEGTETAPLPEEEQHHIDIPDEAKSADDEGHQDDDADAPEDDEDDTPEGDDDGEPDPDADDDQDDEGEKVDEGAENAPLTAEQPEGAPVDPQDTEQPSTEQEAAPTEGESATFEIAPREHSAAPEGKIIKKGDPVSFEAHEVGNQIVVDENVYLEVTARGSNRLTYRLMYRKGTALPKTAVKKTA